MCAQRTVMRRDVVADEIAAVLTATDLIDEIEAIAAT